MTAYSQCCKVNPTNPQAVANQIEAAFKLIEDIVAEKALTTTDPLRQRADAILSAIKEA